MAQLIYDLDVHKVARQRRRGARADRRRRRARGPRARRRAAAGGGQVRAAGVGRRARRGRPDAARREPRAGPRGEGRRPSAPLHVGLHRPPAESQGQADPAVRAADPLGLLRLGAGAARPARGGQRRRGAGRGQRRRRGVEERDRTGGAGRVRRALPGPGRRPDDDAAAGGESRGQPPPLRRTARAGRAARPARAVDGDLAGLRGRGRGGGDDRPPRLDAVPSEAVPARTADAPVGA